MNYVRKWLVVITTIQDEEHSNVLSAGDDLGTKFLGSVSSGRYSHTGANLAQLSRNDWHR